MKTNRPLAQRFALWLIRCRIEKAERQFLYDEIRLREFGFVIAPNEMAVAHASLRYVQQVINKKN